MLPADAQDFFRRGQLASKETNAKQRSVGWRFRIENARVKLKRLCPRIKT
jgi:hypothetical protein